MNQRSQGPWAILSNSSVYKTFQSLIRRGSFRERYIRDYLKPRAGDKILDVGCGPAAILALLPDVTYTGIDFEQHYIDQATEVYAGRPNCRFLKQDVRDLTAAESASYDIVISAGVLHHLDDDVVTSLVSTAHQLLKPGGRLFTLDPARTANQHPVAKLLVSLDRGRHIRQPETYQTLVAKSFGLENCKVTVLHDGMKVPYTHCITVSEKV